jgi:wyosine [tRNA(Phe)-imidazoG37] synthetase (radical SAM superfamily)
MDIAPDLQTLVFDAYPNDPALSQHLDEIIAEIRDRGGIPSPPCILSYALEIGISQTIAADLAELFGYRIKIGRGS